MTSKQKRRNSWIAAIIIASPFVWTVPTYFYLHAQTKAQNTSCESNLKSLHTALQFYARAHQGALPGAQNWTAFAQKYAPSGLRCSADPLKTRPVSYAMNANLSGKKLSEIKNPGQVILLYETNGKSKNPFGVGKDLVDIGKDKSGQGRHNLVAYRFNFFLMADGTIRRAGTLKEKKPLQWK